MDVDKYISDTNNSIVEENQMYKDKSTLKAVMENYKIKNSFNFKVKRFDNKRYVIQFFDNVPNNIYFVYNMFTIIH